MILPVLVADVSKYYQVNLGDEIIIPSVYMIAFAISTLLREFTKGKTRYALLGLFLLSFAVLCFVVMQEYPPVNYIVVVMAVLGVATGAWSGLRKILSDLRKN